MKITIKELANICGVSIGTIDRALNNRPGINSKTKEEILRVVNEIGYKPNLLARSLVKGRTMTIGIVVFNLHNNFFSQLVNNIESYLKLNGYFLYVTLTGNTKEEEINCLDHLASLKVDGIIIFPINQGKGFDQYLKSLSIPIVTIGNMISKHWPFVGIDDQAAMTSAVEYIALKDYKRIIYYSPPLAYKGKVNIYEVEERFTGYKKAVQKQPSIKDSIVITNKKLDQILSIISLRDKKTAILCSSDKFALEIGFFLKGKGVSIPMDVGLMGFDNINMLKYVSPRLTTINYPINQLSVTTCDILIKHIKNEKFSNQNLLPCNIIEGESL